MGCFIYTVFGTSKDITLGPTAILSLLTATLTGILYMTLFNYVDNFITCLLPDPILLYICFVAPCNLLSPLPSLFYPTIPPSSSAYILSHLPISPLTQIKPPVILIIILMLNIVMNVYHVL